MIFSRVSPRSRHGHAVRHRSKVNERDLTIIRPPSIVPDSVVRLQLREHLKIRPDAGRSELVSYILGSISSSADPQYLQLIQIAHGLRHIHDLDATHGHLELVRAPSLQGPVLRTHDAISGNDRGRPRRYSSYIGLPAVLCSPLQSDRAMADAHPSSVRSGPEIGAPRIPRVKTAKANDMHALGVLAWEVVDPPRRLGSFAQFHVIVVYMPLQANPHRDQQFA